MDGIIYISRRCEYCHELLILLHKNNMSLLREESETYAGPEYFVRSQFFLKFRTASSQVFDAASEFFTKLFPCL